MRERRRSLCVCERACASMCECASEREKESERERCAFAGRKVHMDTAETVRDVVVPRGGVKECEKEMLYSWSCTKQHTVQRAWKKAKSRSPSRRSAQHAARDSHLRPLSTFPALTAAEDWLFLKRRSSCVCLCPLGVCWAGKITRDIGRFQKAPDNQTYHASHLCTVFSKHTSRECATHGGIHADSTLVGT
jgi:hypothetical protein